MSSENMSKNSVIFKKGVYELSKALDFMHNVMKKVMVSLNPDNVLIDFKGNWKIGSLFNISSVNDSYYELDFLVTMSMHSTSTIMLLRSYSIPSFTTKVITFLWD